MHQSAVSASSAEDRMCTTAHNHWARPALSLPLLISKCGYKLRQHSHKQTNASCRVESRCVQCVLGFSPSMADVVEVAKHFKHCLTVKTGAEEMRMATRSVTPPLEVGIWDLNFFQDEAGG